MPFFILFYICMCLRKVFVMHLYAALLIVLLKASIYCFAVIESTVLTRGLCFCEEALNLFNLKLFFAKTSNRDRRDFVLFFDIKSPEL